MLLFLYKSFWPSRLGHHFHYSFYILWSVVSFVESFYPKSSLWFLFSVISAYVVLTGFAGTLFRTLCFESFGRSLYRESLFRMISALTRSWREFKILSHLEVLLESVKYKDCDKLKRESLSLYKFIGVCILVQFLSNKLHSLGVAPWISNNLQRLLIPRKNSCVLYFYVSRNIILLSHIAHLFDHFRNLLKLIFT